MTDQSEWDWTDSTPCKDDERFTAGEPDMVTDLILEEICLGCEQFVRCSLWAEEYDAIAVYAAGDWRGYPELDDGFETDPKFSQLEII